jgi:hypothetical protein
MPATVTDTHTEPTTDTSQRETERALVWISEHTHRKKERKKERAKKNPRQKLPKHNLPTNQKQITTTTTLLLLLRASKQTCTEGGRGGRWTKPTVMKARVFSLKKIGVLIFFSVGWCEWLTRLEGKQQASASALASFFFFFFLFFFFLCYLLTKSVHLLREPKRTKSYKRRKVTQVL